LGTGGISPVVEQHGRDAGNKNEGDDDDSY
jgi:hypothetical protein